MTRATHQVHNGSRGDHQVEDLWSLSLALLKEAGSGQQRIVEARANERTS